MRTARSRWEPRTGKAFGPFGAVKRPKKLRRAFDPQGRLQHQEQVERMRAEAARLARTAPAPAARAAAAAEGVEEADLVLTVALPPPLSVWICNPNLCLLGIGRWVCLLYGVCSSCVSCMCGIGQGRSPGPRRRPRGAAWC